jgi:ParB family chromosome partitioning protein
MRQSFDREDLAELGKSLLRYGMLSPLTVLKVAGEYELVVGERRLRAAKLIGMEWVPCRLVTVGPKAGAEWTLAENLCRKELDLFEEASGFDRLMKNFRLSTEDAATAFGRSPSAVAARLRLLRLGREERSLILQGGLSERQARAFLRVADPSLRLFAIKFATDRDFGLRETEEFLDRLLAHPEEYTQRAAEREKKPIRRIVVKDVRLFINSVDRAICAIREAGVDLVAEKSEEEAYISYSIRIPKY